MQGALFLWAPMCRNSLTSASQRLPDQWRMLGAQGRGKPRPPIPCAKELPLLRVRERSAVQCWTGGWCSGARQRKVLWNTSRIQYCARENFCLQGATHHPHKRPASSDGTFGGWCANCRNLRKRQNMHNPQFCTRDVDSRFCGGGE